MKMKMFTVGMLAIMVFIAHSQSLSTISLQVPASIEWYDTGISLSAGEVISITASGSVYIGAVGHGLDYQTPAGSPTGIIDTSLPFIAPNLPWWSLVGKIGSSGTPFEIATSTTITAPTSGELYLSCNDNNFGDDSGNWNVTITVAVPLMYTQSFSSAPGWITDDSRKLLWDSTIGTLHGTQINTEGTYAYMQLPAFNPNGPWCLEWDQRINSDQWSAGLTFGLMTSSLTLYPNGAGMDMGIADAGPTIALFGNGVHDGISDPAWQTGVWYHNVMCYNPSDHALNLTTTERDTGSPFKTLNLTVSSFSMDMTRLGVSRLFMQGNPPGANPSATVDYDLDNIRLYAAQPALQSQLSGTVYSSRGTVLVGASVQIIANASTITDSAGKYSINGLSPGNYSVIVSATGYTSLTASLTVPASGTVSQNFTLNPVLPSGSMPTVTVSTKYNPDGQTVIYFLDGVTFPVTFTANVDWAGHTPGIVKFITPKDGALQVSANGNTASQQIDVGSAFGVGGQLQVQAVSSNGASSIATVASFIVMSALPIPNLSAFSAIDEGNRFEYQSQTSSSFQFLSGSLLGDTGLTIDTSIPLFGGKPIDLGFSPSLAATITGNHLDLLQVEVGGSDPNGNDPGFDLAGLHFDMGKSAISIFANYDATLRQWQWGGNLGVSGDVGASATTYLPVPIPVPVFASVEFDLPFDATLALYNLEPVTWNGTLDLTPTVTGTLGAGVDDVAALTGWIQGRVPLAFQYPQTPHLASYAIQLSAGVTVYVHLWIVNGSASDQLFTWTWPNQNSSAQIFGPLLLNKPISSRPYPRNYLYKLSYASFNGRSSSGFHSAIRPLGLPSGTPNPLLYALQTDVFPFSESSVSADGTNCYAVWLYDNPSRTANNRTMLVYSGFNGTNWSTFSPVADDGTADFHPQLRTFADGSAVVAWENERTVLSTNAEFTAMITNLEIATAFYDPVAEAWQPMRQLTTNDYLDQSPRIAGPTETNLMLVWVANTNNDLEGSATNMNQLWFTTWNGSAWSTPQSFVNAPYPLLKYDMTYDGTNAYVVMSLDADNTLTNVNVHELFEVTYQNGSWGGLQQLTINQVPDDNPQMAIDPNGHVVLTWLQGNTLSSVVDFNFANQQVVATNQYSSNLGDFRLASGGDGRMVIIWAAPSPQYSSDLWRIFYDPKFKIWGNLHQLTADPQTEMETAATFYSTNELIGLYDRVDIAVGDTNQLIQNGTVITNTDLCVLQYQLTNDLALIASSLEVTPANPAPGDTVTLSVGVENLGDSAVSNVLVAFYQGDPANGGVEIGETNLAVLLAPGATNIVSIPWTVPVTTNTLPIYAVIDPSQQYADSDLLNNEVYDTFVEPDLAVQSVTWSQITSNLISVTATVINQGAIASQPAIVSFLMDSLTGTTLFSTNIPGLSPGQSIDVNFIWNMPNIGKGVSLYAVVNTGTNADFNPQDQVVQATIQPSTSEVKVLLGPVTLLPDGVLQVSMTGLAGQKYLIQASTDLVHWTTLTNLTLADGTGQFMDPSTATFPKRFYRAVVFSAVQPQLGAPQMIAGSIKQIAVTGLPGQTYVIEASTNLVNWVTLTNVALPDSVWQFVDPSTNFNQRFYRAVLP